MNKVLVNQNFVNLLVLYFELEVFFKPFWRDGWRDVSRNRAIIKVNRSENSSLALNLRYETYLLHSSKNFIRSSNDWFVSKRELIIQITVPGSFSGVYESTNLISMISSLVKGFLLLQQKYLKRADTFSTYLLLTFYYSLIDY